MQNRGEKLNLFNKKSNDPQLFLSLKIKIACEYTKGKNVEKQ